MPAYRISNKNVLFIHIPKTGGTTIEAFLSSHGPMSLHGKGEKILRPHRSGRLSGHIPVQHFDASLLEVMFDRSFFDYAFMVVREPVERLKSEYRAARALGRVEARLPFGAWTALELARAKLSPHWRSNHYRPQSEFLCLGAEVLRFESGMASILATVSERLALPPSGSIPHKRRSDELAITVSDATRARIRSFYASDYRVFGYP
jgi:hypothetical protein